MEQQTLTPKPNGKYPLGPKYDTTTRIKVRRRIKELAKDGLPYEKIAQIMSTEGFKTPAGAPVNKGLVGNQANAMGLKAYKIRKKHKYMRDVTAKAVAAGQDLLAKKHTTTPKTDYINQILTAENMDATTKIGILKQMRGLA